MDDDEGFRTRASTIGSVAQLRKSNKCRRLSTYRRKLKFETLTDDYESATDEGDAHSPSETSPTTDDPSKKGRRNSIVVIPPMQICPGDLLVYSKVLSQRNTLLDTSRKGKNTWSLLRLFDRSGRSKSESLCGLEEVLSNLQPSEFIDEHLCKYKGMQWAEFVSLWEGRTPKECKGLFRRHSKKQLSSQSGSHQSTLTRTFSRILTPASAEKDSNQENLVSSFTKAQTENKSEAQSMSPVHSNHVGEDGVKDSNDNSIAALDEIEHQIENLGTLTRSRNELKRREAMWDLFQSECMFLDDHLMVLRNVFMEPLKKIQVEGFAMFAEPEVLFGNLEELCCVSTF
ncbi:pleckstriny domain-containing family G member 7-like protein [Trichonephila inaurata madagascariensis]|uniref:Pleckstriny domain-containing family G member 7-like protein n=1 Tax=Trichonephila inaurata madagascariensis TaxID=2747483 RepID=A0A8X6WQT7_9ARAC|nr:pleckstriny domain-containing family G member 7-like protein [Trichonephila inaurata madagascariensis]